jgi:hypothetical protein
MSNQDRSAQKLGWPVPILGAAIGTLFFLTTTFVTAATPLRAVLGVYLLMFAAVLGADGVFWAAVTAAIIFGGYLCIQGHYALIATTRAERSAHLDLMVIVLCTVAAITTCIFLCIRELWAADRLPWPWSILPG